MSRILFAVSFAATLAVAGVLPAAAQVLTAPKTFIGAPDKLTPAEVRATFVGKHHEEGTDVSGTDWTIEAAEDGSLQITAGAFFDAGHMRVNGNAVCVSWAKSWQGKERCFHYAHHGKQLASYGPDGALNSVLTVTR